MNLLKITTKGTELSVEPGPLLWALLILYLGFVIVRANQARTKMRVSKVKIKFPLDMGEVELEVDTRERQAAWNLYVELMTRISTQPMDRDAGRDSAALASLYTLYESARAQLKTAMPLSAHHQGDTFAVKAIELLNKSLRVFLSKWHVRLVSGEVPTELHEDFRKELEALQHDLKKTADAFKALALG